MELNQVEVFATGTNNGTRFEDDDLDEMVRGFNEQQQAGKTAVKIGHTEDDSAPAMGWIQKLYKKGSKLLADLVQVPDALVEQIKEGRYRHVSIELLKDVTTRDGQQYRWLVDGLAILGAARPAVESLAGLHTLFRRGTPGIRFAERLAFSRAPDEAEALRAENKRLHTQLLKQAQDADVVAQRVLPAERERFSRRYGDNGTVADWVAWVKDCPPVPAIYRRGERPAGRAVGADDMPPDAQPDVEVVHLAKAEIEKSGGKLSFSDASQKVLLANPELAERYRHMPGVKDY